MNEDPLSNTESRCSAVFALRKDDPPSSCRLVDVQERFNTFIKHVFTPSNGIAVKNGNRPVRYDVPFVKSPMICVVWNHAIQDVILTLSCHRFYN